MTTDAIRARLVTAGSVRARIKVAVWPDGSWTAYGDSTKTADRTMNAIMDAWPGGENWHWLEADIPLPTTLLLTPNK